MIKGRIWTWGGHWGLSKWPLNVITCILMRGGRAEEDVTREESNVGTEAKRYPVAWKLEEGETSKGWGTAALEARKGTGQMLLSSFWREQGPAAPQCGSVKPASLLASRSLRVNALRLWWFVTRAAENEYLTNTPHKFYLRSLFKLFVFKLSFIHYREKVGCWALLVCSDFPSVS